MRKKADVVILLVFFVLLPSAVFADKVPITIESGELLEKQNKYDQAQVVYEEWLKTGAENPRFFEILKKCGSLEKNAFHVIELYSHYLPAVKDREKQKELLVHIGVHYAMLGDYSAAQNSFVKAFTPLEKPQKDLFILAPAQLALLSGDPDKALLWLQQVYPVLYYETDKAEALYLLVEVAVMKNNTEYAEEVLGNIAKGSPSSPAYARALYRIIVYFNSKKDTGKSTVYRNQLKEKFPSSPEYLALTDNINDPKIMVMTLPHEFIAFQSEQEIIAETGKSSGKEKDSKAVPVLETQTDKKEITNGYSIQIGSYTMQENAQFILRDAVKLGFSGDIIETQIRGKTYYRVFIGRNLSEKEAQQTLAKLNDKGFSGFLYSN
ncbi:MAG: SPOR domain-containing protein [Spirochaetales bacterium]|nr:SPOR domain-containing protein [Spirochaetales bacterium]